MFGFWTFQRLEAFWVDLENWTKVYHLDTFIKFKINILSKNKLTTVQESLVLGH